MTFHKIFNRLKPTQDLPKQAEQTEEEKNPCSTMENVVVEHLSGSYYAKKPDYRKELAHEMIYDMRGSRSLVGFHKSFDQCLGQRWKNFDSKRAEQAEANILAKLPKP